MPEHTPNPNDIVDAQIKILSVLFDKSVAYTNVIIIGGYASFFGLWSLTKQYLTVTQARWAALSMLLSASVFVSFEVYKMVVTTNVLLARAKMLEDPTQIDQYEQSLKRHNVSFIRLWRVNVIVAVATALVAVGILLFSFVCGLFRAT